jgi:hypothetical protein
LAVLTARTSSGGAQAQPIFQPVNENDLPPLEIVTVRSRIPGYVAIGRCTTSSNVRCS